MLKMEKEKPRLMLVCVCAVCFGPCCRRQNPMPAVRKNRFERAVRTPFGFSTAYLYILCLGDYLVW